MKTKFWQKKKVHSTYFFNFLSTYQRDIRQVFPDRILYYIILYYIILYYIILYFIILYYIILYYIILLMVKINLNVFSITFYHHVQAIQVLFDSVWIWTVKWMVNQMNLIQSQAVQRQVKWTVHHCEIPQSLNTSFLLLLFFQWLFLSSDSVCPFVLTPRDTT